MALNGLPYVNDTTAIAESGFNLTKHIRFHGKLPMKVGHFVTEFEHRMEGIFLNIVVNFSVTLSQNALFVKGLWSNSKTLWTGLSVQRQRLWER